MTTAQPGQEQRMVTVDMIEAGLAIFDRDYGGSGLQMAGSTLDAIYAAMHAARPTADLGEDGEMVARLRADADRQDGEEESIVSTNVMRNAADRLILYREARDELVKIIADAVEELKPFSPELDEADISEALYKRMTDALARISATSARPRPASDTTPAN